MRPASPAWAAASLAALAAGLPVQGRATLPFLGGSGAAAAAPAAVSPSAAPTSAPPEPRPAPVPGFIDFVASGRSAVEAALGTLDGGSLTRALRRAARQGRRLRLVLDPYDADSRAQAHRLRSLSARVLIRWRGGQSDRPRWMWVEGVGSLAWREGVMPRPAPAGGRAAFEADWRAALTELPEILRLRQRLEALPDPRETTPHYVRRAAGAP